MKKRFIQGKYLLLFILLSISSLLRAQNAPITTASTQVACPSSSISVPVTVTAFTAISSITLKIEFDSAVMTFNAGASTFNASLLGGSKNSSPVGPGSTCAVFIAWSNIFGQTLADGSTIINLGFNYINGSTALHFNNSSNFGGDCEYATVLGGIPITLIDTPTIVFYHDGHVSSGVVGGTVSGSSNITFGDSTGTFTVSGYVGNVVKWQKQFNGGGYVDITPFNTGTHYKAKPDTTGVWNYRAVVQYGSCPQAFSAPATDTVTAVNHAKTWTGAASTNWKKSVNWNPYGIPMLSENVTIPSGLSRYPLVSDQGLGCNNLTVEALATMNINSGIHLTINGTLNILGP